MTLVLKGSSDKKIEVEMEKNKVIHIHRTNSIRTFLTSMHISFPTMEFHWERIKSSRWTCIEGSSMQISVNGIHQSQCMWQNDLDQLTDIDAFFSLPFWSGSCSEKKPFDDMSRAPKRPKLEQPKSKDARISSGQYMKSSFDTDHEVKFGIAKVFSSPRTCSCLAHRCSVSITHSQCWRTVDFSSVADWRWSKWTSTCTQRTVRRYLCIVTRDQHDLSVTDRIESVGEDRWTS